VSYNVWFGEFHSETRFEAISKLLWETQADVICLQEVTEKFIRTLSSQPWVRESYIISHVGPDIGSYGIWLLSKLPVHSLYKIELPTFMERYCLVAECVINREIIVFATAHLESLDTAQIRKEQLEIISKHLQHYTNVIFTGDFNFDADLNYSDHLKIVKERKERLSQLQSMDKLPTPETPKLAERNRNNLENNNLREYFSDYIDVWPELHWSTPDDKGYTFDSEANTMLTDYERMRYDRMMFKSSKSNWRAVSIELLGAKRLKTDIVDPETGKEVVLFPSDHFGLLTVITE